MCGVDVWSGGVESWAGGVGSYFVILDKEKINSKIYGQREYILLSLQSVYRENGRRAGNN